MSFFIANQPMSPNERSVHKGTPAVSLKTLEQLEVDVCKTQSSIIVYAQVAGADIADIQISIEGKSNIVIIEGVRTRPPHSAFVQQDIDTSFYTQECIWGGFYRKIILPCAIDSQKAEADIVDGVLMLELPLHPKLRT